MYHLTPQTASTIANVRHALADQPGTRDEVIGALTLADKHKQHAQELLTRIAHELGMCKQHPKPVDGGLQEQAQFLVVWLVAVKPDEATCDRVLSFMDQAENHISVAAMLARQVSTVLRQAGDAAS